MTRTLTHAEAQELLATVALEAASSEERSALLAHAADCEMCAHELGATRDTVQALGQLAPHAPMNPDRQSRVRGRLLARVAGTRAAPPGPPRAIPLPPRRLSQIGIARLVAAAAILVSGVALGVYAVAEQQRANRLEQELQGAISAQRTLERKVAARDSAIADKNALLDAVTGPGVQVIEAGAPSARQPTAKMFWDQPADRWTFIAHNLPRPAANRTYQVWLITREKKMISAGVLSISPSGDAQLVARYPLPKNDLAAIALTEEPAGGSPQPTGSPILEGQVK